MTMQPIPMPPFAMREMVGATDEEFFDNPTGKPVYPELPVEVWESVFDFGCGCGRLARQLLQMKEHKPRRYVGIDVHRGMIDWCSKQLGPIDPRFRFSHHDVWSPSYGRGNSPKLAEPFPVEDGAFTLFFANSVFTHIYKEQAEYYLHEVARILRPGGLAITTWFFFDNASFPFMRGGVPTLFTSETDPTSAVIYDRQWFIDTLRGAGLAVKHTQHPPVAGHQWWLQLEKRTPSSVDKFPLGDEAAEWLCGATRKPIANPEISQAEIERHRVGRASSGKADGPPKPPPLTGPAAELAAVQQELATIKRSWSWKLARVVIEPVRLLKRVLPTIRS
jgi:SAM-dependent methyltransferase